MQTPGSQFLHERNPNLHSSQEVEGVVDYLRSGGESIPNEPSDKISAYLGFLANGDYVNDGILTGDQSSIDRQIDAHVIKAGDVPEGYFELQRRIAREQGHGDITISREMREQMIEAVQADQRVGLGKWVEYLGGEDGGYPDWFKHYTFSSVTKLGGFDKEKGEFLKRSKGTTASYPELNREALAYVYDTLNKSRVQGERVDDVELQKLLKSGNFGKLYAHAVLATAPTSPELLKDTRGSWTKFNQTNDPRTARRLSGSLQGHGTGWCTAGESTAKSQLSGGDFYVYYTRDEDGKDTVPRVAIRMQGGEVAEVRGINATQELEPELADIASEQLQGLPGGEEYIRRAEDMKRLTAIDKKITADPSIELSKEEIRFLYEFDHEIQGFGYETDPRIAEIRVKRGERDYPELKVLAIEYLRESFETTYAGYNSLATELNKLRQANSSPTKRLFGRHSSEHGPTEQLPILSREQLSKLYEDKLAEWQENGIFDYVYERIVTHGERYTPIARPNVVTTTEELKQLAHNFAKSQGLDEAYVYDPLYGAYTTYKELVMLSGFRENGDPVEFSLMPNKFSDELGYKTAEDNRQTLADMQAKKPKLNIRVPSVLDSLGLWRTLRALGDKLKSGDVYQRTGIRHFNLPGKHVDGDVLVPYSIVGDGVGPILSGSDTRVVHDARVSVG